MGDNDGIGERIYSAVLTLGQGVGRLEEECRQHSEHLASIDRRLEAGSSQMHGYGAALAQQGQRLDQLQAHLDEADTVAQMRRRKCSETIRALGLKINGTDRSLVALDGQRQGLRMAGKILAAILGLVISAAGAFQLGQCRSNGARHIHNVQAPVKAAAKR